jgi:hypothetical protein
MRPMRTHLRLHFSVVLLLAFAADVRAQSISNGQVIVRSVDEARASDAGIRKLAGRHLVLYTDLPSGRAIDSLPAVFDQAVQLWAEYFGVDLAQVADWQVRSFLIGDRAKFEALGLTPADNALIHGYARGSDVWLSDQPTDYYRRHLLLHEGTHAFMATFLGGCGPGWYSEGMAELLATHRLDSETGKLTLNIMPRDRQEVPMLGRIKLVRDAVVENHALALPAVMEIDNRQQLGNDAYAWCWAAATFLDSHPRYRERFRTLQKQVQDPNFNDMVRREFADDWDELLAEWQAYVATLEHGYDFERMAIRFERGTPLSGKSQTGRGVRREVTVAADRGWQSSGVWLEARKTYRVTARGRFQIAVEKGLAWPCEPGGVTIEYHDSRPLGMLLGAIVPAGAGGATFAKPQAIGLGCEISPDVSGTLYLRVNDSAARLGDNRGALTIEIAD